MSTILILNAGSSSVKFQLMRMPEENLIASGLVERIGLEVGGFTLSYNGNKEKLERTFNDHAEAISFVLNQFIEKGILTSLDEITAVGHRVVQGGDKFSGSVIVDDVNEQLVEDLAELAPLHNKASLIGYRSFKDILPEIKHVFVFDTAFHQTMSPESYLYPLPYEWYEKFQVRRYGAHGTSHRYVANKALETMGMPSEGSRLLTCHLGNGASITAIKDGKSINTSMGFTPLGGIMMGTRSGNIDPAIIPYVGKKLGISAQEVIDKLNKESGMLGVSGLSSDARDVIEAAQSGDEKAQLTLSVYIDRIRDYIGAYAMQLRHIDAIVFTAGVGENSSFIRKLVIDEVRHALGIEISDELNAKNGDEHGLISTENSAIKVFVIPTNEELVIARDTYELTK
ncbi:MAG: acetate kinase [Erysipelotrichaceae bacterium]